MQTFLLRSKLVIFGTYDITFYTNVFKTFLEKRHENVKYNALIYLETRYI